MVPPQRIIAKIKIHIPNKSLNTNAWHIVSAHFIYLYIICLKVFKRMFFQVEMYSIKVSFHFRNES